MLPLYYLICTTSFLIISQSFAELIDCKNVPQFSVEVEQERIFFDHAEINVEYDRKDLAVYEYPDTNAVNFLINYTTVSFSGHIANQNKYFNSDESKLSRSLITQIAGTGELLKSTSNYHILDECNVYLARSRKYNTEYFPAALQKEILHQAASCLRKEICEKLDPITLDDLRNAKSHPYAFGSLTVKAKNKNVYDGVQTMNANNLTTLMNSVEQLHFNSVDKNGLQSTINILVDLAIAEFVREVRKENQGTIKIPDINQRFSENSVWHPNGEFDATDGLFSDLTTLSRTEDAHLSHDGLKFIASCGFGLSKANIHYEKYKLKYGIKVSGKLSAKIDGIAISTSVAVDYNQKPCKAMLQDLHITNIGTIKIKMTGLGPLNKLLSKLVTWISKKWKEELVTQVEYNARDIVREHLSDFDCEKYRP